MPELPPHPFFPHSLSPLSSPFLRQQPPLPLNPPYILLTLSSLSPPLHLSGCLLAYAALSELFPEHCEPGKLMSDDVFSSCSIEYNMTADGEGEADLDHPKAAVQRVRCSNVDKVFSIRDLRSVVPPGKAYLDIVVSGPSAA